MREGVVSKAGWVALPDQVHVPNDISLAILVDVALVLAKVISHDDHGTDILLRLVSRRRIVALNKPAIVGLGLLALALVAESIRPLDVGVGIKGEDDATHLHR